MYLTFLIDSSNLFILQSLAPDVNSTRKAHISHFEKFPSRGRHATFVTSVQPETAELGNDLPVTVTVTIFAPDYVPNQTRHSVSFFILKII